LEDLKNNYFTVEVKELPSGIAFEDEGFKEFCLRDKRLNVDKDNMITEKEAKAATRLSLMNFKSFIRNIKSYADLKYFPNLEYLHAGMTYVETLDVSCCPKLKELDASDCRMLKEILLVEGCKPEISGQNNVQVKYVKVK
jgi:Leucine-rich repeat (LRR) protein